MKSVLSRVSASVVFRLDDEPPAANWADAERKCDPYEYCVCECEELDAFDDTNDDDDEEEDEEDDDDDDDEDEDEEEEEATPESLDKSAAGEECFELPPVLAKLLNRWLLRVLAVVVFAFVFVFVLVAVCWLVLRREVELAAEWR